MATMLLAVLPLGTGSPADASAETVVAPGVRYEQLARPGLVAHVARIAPTAAFLRPVLAADTVGGGSRESVSAMCARAGGIICINSDFAACPTCREPYGGVVVDGQVIRSPHAGHEQLTFTKAGMTTERWAWGARLVAEHVWWVDSKGAVPVGPTEGQRVELRRVRRELPIGGMNVQPIADGAVLYTPAWGPGTPGSDLEVLLGTNGSTAPGAAAVELGPQRTGGGPVPGGGAVLAANGSAADDLARIADEWRRSDATEKRLVLETATSAEVLQSVGGHPVLLRDGQRQAWSRDDPKARGRHPRTLVGWTAAGEVLLVVADGRRPGHSEGLTLEESADLMAGMGAVHALNLDGGGSSTFVGPCAEGPCVLNHPSDGRERLVPGALVLLGDQAAVMPVRPASPAPLGPPAAPTEPDPASTAHVEEPEPTPEEEQPVLEPEPTPAEEVIVAPIDDEPPPPAAVVGAGGAGRADFEFVAAPPMSAERGTGGASRLPAAAAAVAAAGAAGVAAVRARRRAT